LLAKLKIPFNRPSLRGRENQYLNDAIARNHISGDGPFTKICEALIQQELNVEKVLLATSCTHALEMSCLLLDLKEGDEFITPSFTFVSTVNAFIMRGARPVFADIRIDTLNIDETKLERLITPRTKAIVVVHYAGVACEMSAILAIAEKYGIPIVEDNAHGLFGRYKGEFLGTLGTLATQSFHETKNFTCGEGGALLINDSQYIDRAEIIREKGTDRGRFFRGQVDKYSWMDVGSSYVLSDLLAAFLLAQLEDQVSIQTERGRIWSQYNTRLSEWSAKNGVRLPIIPPECEQPFHMFYMILPSLEVRQKLISHLEERGIQAVYHYLPLHLSRMGQKLGGADSVCPVTEFVSDRLLRLPFFNSLQEAEIEDVIRAVESFSDFDYSSTSAQASPFSSISSN